MKELAHRIAYSMRLRLGIAPQVSFVMPADRRAAPPALD
jgi:hypothetical protein